MITAFDAEGIELADGSAAVEGWAGGIAHNYEDPGVLVNQVYGPVAWISSPVWIAALSMPPLIYGLTASVILVRKTRRRESLSTRTRRALRRLDEVAAGRVDWTAVLEDFWSAFAAASFCWHLR